MTTIVQILHSIIELFLDDEFLAAGILAIVAITVLLVIGLGARPLLAGSVLFAGNILVLVLSILRTARRT